MIRLLRDVIAARRCGRRFRHRWSRPMFVSTSGRGSWLTRRCYRCGGVSTRPAMGAEVTWR